MLQPLIEKAEVDQFYEDLENLLELNAESQRIARRDWDPFFVAFLYTKK